MRKSSSHAFVNEFLVYSLVALCFGGSIGLGTVWMRHQISVTANASRMLEVQIANVERQIQATDSQIQAQAAPAVLSQRNNDWHLGLVPAVQVVLVSEKPEDHLARKQQTERFDRTAPRITLGGLPAVASDR